MRSRLATAGLTSIPVPPSATVRSAGTAYRVLAAVTLLGIATQFFLAGTAVFNRQRQGASDGYFGPHVMLGMGIAVLTLLLALTAAVSHAAAPIIRMTVALFILAGPIEPLLAALGDNNSAWFGGLHAFTGAAIAALAAILFRRSWRRTSSQDVNS